MYYSKRNLIVSGVLITVIFISALYLFKTESAFMRIYLTEQEEQTNNPELPELTDETETTPENPALTPYGSEQKSEESSISEDKAKENEKAAESIKEENIKEENIKEENIKEETNTYLPVSSENRAENKENKNKEKNTAGPDLTPISGEWYKVKEGDTLFYISKRSGLSISDLKAMNDLNSDNITEGQYLLIDKKHSKIALQAEAADNSDIITTNRGSFREDDIYWLSRIIHAEAQGEPYKGKVAVGNVVLNRVASSKFPNTIYGVIFDKQEGYTQFSPVLDGNIYNTPNKDSIRAAKDALSGARPVGDALYFLNIRKATNFWIVENREFFMTIGEHDFYY